MKFSPWNFLHCSIASFLLDLPVLLISLFPSPTIWVHPQTWKLTNHINVGQTKGSILSEVEEMKTVYFPMKRSKEFGPRTLEFAFKMYGRFSGWRQCLIHFTARHIMWGMLDMHSNVQSSFYSSRPYSSSQFTM
jgi:hypothetical protein